MSYRPRFTYSLLALALTPTLLWAEEPTELDAATVTGERADNYRVKRASVTAYDDAPLRDTPASVTVISEQLLADQQPRLLSEVLKNDASVGDSYAPVGYYENFVVRGFSLNAASSYKINGRTIAGEQNVALENKQRVELLKGLAGLQAGVSEPGGLVNYVTKRAADVRSVTVSTNEQGERYLATDVGGWFGSEQQFGLRANLAHEDIRSYVDHSDGKRDFASLAFDWNISPDALLQLDVEYQQREQLSAPGYQLLGGRRVPHGIDPSDKLAHPGWAKPVGIDSLNTSGRFEYRFSEAWVGALSASRSHVVIDDYSAFAWGCYGAASCASDAVANYFSAEGDYDVYDYRSPDDTRWNDELEATLSGTFATGFLDHHLTLGSGASRRIVERRTAVNEWVGTGNIYQPAPVLAEASAALSDKTRRLDSRQYALFINDRIRFNEHWQTVLGGRLVRLDEEAYDGSGVQARHTQRSEFLPDLALIYKPREDTTLYGRYSEGLAQGGEAPWFATNAEAILAPADSRQYELGLKRDWRRVSASVALFRIERDYQYSRPNGDGSYTYVAQGEQHNTGLELAASGWLTERLQLAASTALIRARVTGSGTAEYEGHQAINVPTLRSSLSFDYRVPGFDGLALLGGVQYSGSKYASQAGQVKVDDYAVFDLGGRYTLRVEGYETVLRLSVDNLFDKRYWRDASEYLGDGYLFQGAPRTARLAATVSF
ncbi:TonB-dependent siderophore receptor [Pseudomonas sp. SH1-B]